MKAFDFSSLKGIRLVGSNFGQEQWDDMYSLLPADGLLLDGLPVPLQCLDITKTPLASAEAAMEEKILEASLVRRAPFSDLWTRKRYYVSRFKLPS